MDLRLQDLLIIKLSSRIVKHKGLYCVPRRQNSRGEKLKVVSNPAKPVILGIFMATRPLTLGIYYTNQSLVSIIIWLNIATKLCRATDATKRHKMHKGPAQRFYASCAPLWLKSSGPAGGGRFFGEVGLFVRIQTGEEVKSLASLHHAQKAERVFQYLACFQPSY